MNGAESAVNLATKLEDIGFDDFTANLIDATFKALLNTHITQLDTYADLVKEIAEGLDNFIAKNKDSVRIEEVYKYIGFSLDEPITQEQLDYLKNSFAEGKAISTTQQDELFKIESKPNNPDTNKVYKEDLIDIIKERILRRRYNILENLVTKGLVRLVIDFGEIETKLLFSVYGASSQASAEFSKSVSEQSLNISGSASFKSKKFSLDISGSYSKYKLGVKTTSVYDRDTTGSKVDIYARVYIRFKSDYLPLNPAEFGT